MTRGLSDGIRPRRGRRPNAAHGPAGGGHTYDDGLDSTWALPATVCLLIHRPRLPAYVPALSSPFCLRVLLKPSSRPVRSTTPTRPRTQSVLHCRRQHACATSKR